MWKITHSRLDSLNEKQSLRHEKMKKQWREQHSRWLTAHRYRTSSTATAAPPCVRPASLSAVVSPRR